MIWQVVTWFFLALLVSAAVIAGDLVALIISVGVAGSALITDAVTSYWWYEREKKAASVDDDEWRKATFEENNRIVAEARERDIIRRTHTCPNCGYSNLPEGRYRGHVTPYVHGLPCPACSYLDGENNENTTGDSGQG